MNPLDLLKAAMSGVKSKAKAILNARFLEQKNFQNRKNNKNYYGSASSWK